MPSSELGASRPGGGMLTPGRIIDQLQASCFGGFFDVSGS